MAQNAFAVTVTDTPSILAEPINGCLTDIFINNTTATTIYIDINNPSVDSTNGMPISQNDTPSFTLMPNSVIYAVTASGTAVIRTLRNKSALTTI